MVLSVRPVAAYGGVSERPLGSPSCLGLMPYNDIAEGELGRFSSSGGTQVRYSGRRCQGGLADGVLVVGLSQKCHRDLLIGVPDGF